MNKENNNMNYLYNKKNYMIKVYKMKQTNY